MKNKQKNLRMKWKPKSTNRSLFDLARQPTTPDSGKYEDEEKKQM